MHISSAIPARTSRSAADERKEGMDKPVHLVEFETMLLSRYQLSSRRRAHGMLERSSYLLLSRLAIDGPLSIRQLSDALHLDASTLSRQIGTLLRDGLVERIPDPEGGMARKFRTSAEGEQRLEAERAATVSGLECVMHDWTPQDVAAFADYLRRFNGSIEQLDGRPWPRPTTSGRLPHR
ncbi:MarR family winged helix-turn-helix transcriptional regulator [Nocardia sp. CA-119907]|uniref:MarR family winged helix-turn-helix transcriptional regulator n=1 Tax=Nocardia sp. CA-119907 TaxID=3239973 RepID=UPI003D95136E